MKQENPKYRLLDIGETIKEGDEFKVERSNEDSPWKPATRVGSKVHGMVYGRYRRIRELDMLSYDTNLLKTNWKEH